MLTKERERERERKEFFFHFFSVEKGPFPFYNLRTTVIQTQMDNCATVNNNIIIHKYSYFQTS